MGANRRQFTRVNTELEAHVSMFDKTIRTRMTRDVSMKGMFRA